jgi:uncharacterized integral membrane protein
MNEIPRSADKLVDLILNTPGVLDQVAANPENTLRKIAKEAKKELPPPALVVDRWIYRIVVLALGMVAILAITGAILLSVKTPSGTTIQIPDILTALGAAAIGALTGLLVPSPTTK